MKFFEWQLVR